MDGIAYLKDCCQKRKINPDEFLKFGRGANGPRRIGKKHRQHERYVLTLGASTPQSSQLYAVQYCKDIGVYIAWEFKRRQNFSLMAKDIIQPLGAKVCSVKKHLQYSGWGEELVLYFQKEGIPDFLERYVKKG